MSEDFVLEANPRKDMGKGASRRLRRLADEMPAIIYGAGKDPTAISLQHKDMMHAIENEAFFSHVITIKLGKTKESVVIKALQRHPAQARVLHADFLRVSADQALTVKVPLHFLNEDTCVGVKTSGGQINHLMNELEITCLPKDLPEFIEVDMIEVDLGESLHISDLSLPEGVVSIDLSHGEANDLAIAAVNVIRVIEEPEEEPVEGEEGEEVEAGEEGDEAADAGDGGDKAADKDDSTE